MGGLLLPSSSSSSSCFAFFYVVLVTLLSVGHGAIPSHLEAIYPDVCRFAKGSVKLYNCDAKYKSPLGYANLDHPTSPQRYLIKLKDSFTSTTVDNICDKAEKTKEYPGYCLHRYKKVWLGMLMVISGRNLKELVRKEAHTIDHVEIDGTVRVTVLQKSPPWGLDRIDRRAGYPLYDSLYNVSASGADVHVYILDSGIRCTHQEFWYADGRTNLSGIPLSRCLDGFDGIRDGLGTNDCNGHGTHCAGCGCGKFSF